MGCLPGYTIQQGAAEFCLSAVLGQAGPAFLLLLQPQEGVGVALHFVMQLQHQVLQPPVVPAEAEGIRKLRLARGHVRVKLLPHPGQHPLPQQCPLPLVQHPEVRRQPSLVP